MLGDEVANFLASGDRGTRLMRGLAMDARARGMWARLMNEQGGARRHKSGSKKGTGTTRSGCFGHKMDRIGTISGMGCQPAYYPSTNNLSWCVDPSEPLRFPLEPLTGVEHVHNQHNQIQVTHNQVLVTQKQFGSGSFDSNIFRFKTKEMCVEPFIHSGCV